MLTGIHAPTAGATDEFKRVAEALHASVFSWLAMDTNGPHRPQDALSYDGTHILRIPSPAPNEPPSTWLARVQPILDLWVNAGIPQGALIVQHANEVDANGVDVPVPWGIGAWLVAAHGYRDAIRTRYGNLPLLAPPFTCGNTSKITADYLSGYNAAAIHCYFSINNPGWRQGKDGGQAWRNATDLGVPVYVTEINSNPTNPDEIVAWANEVDNPLVLGATLFIADSPQSFPEYTINAQQAAAVTAGLSIPQPAPDPPLPPPEPAMYDRSYDPRGYRPLDQRWRSFVAARNPGEADAIFAAYDQAARAVNYDPNAAIAQGAVETAIFTSQRWRNAHNAAGIGIFSDGTPDVQFGTVENGIRAQLELLSDYFGDGSEPWGILKQHGFGGMHLGKTKLSDMDGVWAADTGYSAAIVQYMNTVLGGDAPPAPQPQPPPQAYAIVYPVDAPILQGSDGSFSHGGNVPGFYAIDFGCPSGTPVIAAADGIVRYAYWQDANPISARTGHSLYIAHDNGYSTFSCHLSRFDVQVGERVAQGQIIGLSGDPASQPGNGYGDGPHLHWEIWQGVWGEGGYRIKLEDLTAQGIAGPYDADAVIVDKWETAPMVGDGFSDDEILRLWYGTNKPTATAKKNYPYNHDFGIETAYRDLANGNFKTDDQDLLGKSIVLGKCISKEEPDTGTPGRSVRYFSEGKITALKQADGSYRFRVN